MVQLLIYFVIAGVRRFQQPRKVLLHLGQAIHHAQLSLLLGADQATIVHDALVDNMLLSSDLHSNDHLTRSTSGRHAL